MYRTIVASKVRATFAALSAGEHEVLTAQLADPFEYAFRGDHALGGTRTSKEGMHAWFARVYALFPGIEFAVRDVSVAGPPWNTVVLTHVGVMAQGYENEMFQKLNLRWGRLTSIVTLENLEVLQQHLAGAAQRGVAEASARAHHPVVAGLVGRSGRSGRNGRNGSSCDGDGSCAGNAHSGRLAEPADGSPFDAQDAAPAVDRQDRSGRPE